MIKEIITDVNKLLDRSDECDVRKNSNVVRATVVDLKDTMIANDIACLAAPQIGIPIRVVMMNIDGHYKALCNPFITEANPKGFTLHREADVCMPGRQFIVTRYHDITVHYLNPLGQPEAKKLIGMAAFLLEQAIDHLEGILPEEIGMEIDEDFDKATEDERAELVKYFLDSLNVKYTDLQKQIEEDPEAKKLNDAVRFMEARDRGEIEMGMPISGKELDELENKNHE